MREGGYDWPSDWSGNLTLFFRDITIKDREPEKIVTLGEQQKQ